MVHIPVAKCITYCCFSLIYLLFDNGDSVLVVLVYQELTGRVNKSAKLFGLKINVSKTKIMTISR